MNKSSSGTGKQGEPTTMATSQAAAASGLHDTHPPPPASARPDFRDEDFKDLIALIGPEAVLKWIDELRVRLQGLMEEDEAPDELQRVVHGIISKAGMLGFRGLAESCARLEQEMLADSGITELETMRREAQRVSETLPQLEAVLRGSKSL